METPLSAIGTSAITRAAARLSATTLAVIAVLLVVPVTARAQEAMPQGWVSLDELTATSTPPSLEILFSDLSEIILQVRTPGVVTRSIEHEDTEYRELSFPGCYHSEEVGHPLLPAVRQLIAVPDGCDMEVSISLGDSVIWTDTAVYPVEAAVTRYTEEGWPYIAYEFARDNDAYEASGYYPREIATVSASGSLRGQGVALLTVYPIQYDAAASRLRAFPSLAVTLRFRGGTSGVSESLGPLWGIAQGVLLNYQGIGAGSRESAGPGDYGVCNTVQACAQLDADYLMIVEGSLMGSAWVDTLALHRATWNGWNVAIVPDSAVIDNYEGATEISDEAIKDFIRDVYDTESAGHMDDGYLGYVLLVGDAKDTLQGGAHVLLPAHEQRYVYPSIYYVTTDHWYSCVNGNDDYADLMIGRLCAGDTTELRREVTKYTAYERSADSTAAWRDDVLLSCGYSWIAPPECGPQDQDLAALAQASFDSTKALLSQRYDVSEIHAHSQMQQTCELQHDAVEAYSVNAVNAGVFIAELAVHGDEPSCYTFEPGDVDQLTNADSLCFWMSISCWTGGYDYCENGTLIDCLGEQLLHRNGLNGAVAFFGATDLSGSPAIEYLTSYVWEAFFEQHLHSLGEAIAFAKLKHLSVTGSSFEVCEYNLLGDPALNLFLANSSGYGTKPDYVVGPSDLRTSPDFPSVSQPAQFQAVIHNRSNCNPDNPVAVRLELCERDGTDCAPADTVLVQPMAWSADTASVAWSIGQADVGQYLLKVTVDPRNEQLELFEDNNAAETFVGAYFERAGFPDSLGGTGGLSPTVANVDADPELEILAAIRSPGKVVPCSYDGELGDPFVAPQGAPIRGPVAVADLDGDGEQEVVVCYGDTVMALNADDLTPAWATPHYAQGLDAASPTVADVIGADGELEVLVQRAWGTTPLNRDALDVLSADGSPAWSDPAYGGRYDAAFPDRAPAVADVEGDGTYEVVRVFPANVRVVRPEAEALVWERGIVVSAGLRACSPVLANVCPDSSGLEVLCGVDTLRCHLAGGDLLWSYDTMGHIAGIAAADLDDDDELEVVVSTYRTATEAGGATGWVYVIDEGALADSIRCEYGVTTGPVIADLDGYGGSEIIVGSSLWREAEPPGPWMSHLDIFTFDPVSRLLEPFFDRPLFFWGELTSTPAVADADLDGQMEIHVVDGMGILHCLEYWDTGSPSRWASFQHDERHTGTYETPVAGTYPESSAISWWGDYLMTDDVTVGASSSLLIQPGSTIRATTGTSLDVGGAMTVWGMPLHEVTFESAETAPAPGDWTGIHLGEGSYTTFTHTTISDASIGIDATDPLRLGVRNCTLTDNEIKGIKCTGNNGMNLGAVSILGNNISSVPIGVELQLCRATVDTNTIEECTEHGMKIHWDRGSKVRRNTIVPVDSVAISGIYVQNCEDDLIISRNTIGSWDANFPNRGIDYELSDPADGGIIKKNTIITGGPYAAYGMYFYYGDPQVRANTITGDAISSAFYVRQTPPNCQPVLPDLGQANGTCADCSDTTRAGCNRVLADSMSFIQYYARGLSTCPDTTMAECNYWGADSLDAGKFFGRIDWNPYLPDDPLGGRGRAAEGEEEQQPPAPELTFLQNTPNPFNPETVFRFGLPERADVGLQVYDLAGRRVRTLMDGAELDPGWHEVVWDGRNNQGETVATGVYFCRLTVGNRELSRKVVVLK